MQKQINNLKAEVDELRGVVKKLEANLKHVNSGISSQGSSLEMLQSSFSGLNKSYAFIQEQLQDINKKLSSRDLSFETMHKVYLKSVLGLEATIGRLNIKIDELPCRGNKDGKKEKDCPADVLE